MNVDVNINGIYGHTIDMDRIIRVIRVIIFQQKCVYSDNAVHFSSIRTQNK